MFLVNEYYAKAGPGMDPIEVIDGPVYTGPDNEIRIGQIIGYNPKTGFLHIKLTQDVYYKDLIKSGIPLENIIFKNSA